MSIQSASGQGGYPLDMQTRESRMTGIAEILGPESHKSLDSANSQDKMDFSNQRFNNMTALSTAAKKMDVTVAPPTRLDNTLPKSS